MSKLDGRVNKLEGSDTSREATREEISEQDRAMLAQLAAVELSVCPDLELVTEADTDPQTFKQIQRTLAEARGEFEPELPLESSPKGKSAPPPSAPRKRQSGRHRDEDADGMLEALAFIDKATADASGQAERMEHAVEAANRRLAAQT